MEITCGTVTAVARGGKRMKRARSGEVDCCESCPCQIYINILDKKSVSQFVRMLIMLVNPVLNYFTALV